MLRIRIVPALMMTAARGSHVDELMNRGMRTGVGGQRAKTRKRKQVERRHSRVGERLVGGWLVRERSGARPHRPADRSRGVSAWATDVCACAG